MNLALGAIIFAILLIPPLILIYVYGKGTHARGIPKLSLVEYLLLSAVLSLFLHGAVIHFFNLDINYPFLVQFLSGQLNDAGVNKNIAHYRSYFIGFAKYIFWLCLFAWVVGNLLKFIATSRRLRMNRMLQWFRNDRKPNDMVAYFNNWWYFFRANEYSREYEGFGRNRPLVYVDILTDIKDTTVLYNGILHDYVIRDGELETIFLHTSSKSFFIRKNADQSIRFDIESEIPISPSGMFSIPYSKVLNMHVRFVSAEPTEDEITEDFLNQLIEGEPIERTEADTNS